MADLKRLRIVWGGPGIVGPGVTTLHFLDSVTNPGAVMSTFFGNQLALFPVGTTITVPQSGDIIDSANGEIKAAWSAGTNFNLVGTGTGVFQSGVGARVVWNTGSRAHGRLVRGTTFLVPLVSSKFNATGVLDPTVASSIKTAATAVLTASSNGLVVWSRPRGGSGGGYATATSADVPVGVTWLRSRRV